MRISGLAASPTDAEIVMSELWDLGTTGLLEAGLDEGAILAGFPSRPEAEQAAGDLIQRFNLSAGQLAVEPAAPIEHWQPPGQTTRVEVAVSGRDPLGIEIDAGPTFGHGSHPTTRLALDLMTSVFCESGDQLGPNPSLLDVGTGSGILAIAGAKLGANKVVAIDNDPTAVNVAIGNADKNSVTIASSQATLAEIAKSEPEGFDVIVINVLLPAHAELARGVLDNVAEHGRIITSGYLESQSDELLKQYQPLGSARAAIVDDWAGHVLKR